MILSKKIGAALVFLCISGLAVSCGNTEGEDSESMATVALNRLPRSGPGYYVFVTDDRVWGNPSVIANMEQAGYNWKLLGHDQIYGRIGVNDISLQNGGDFSPHGSHKAGKDIDMRPVRADGIEGATDINALSYSFEGSKSLITGVLKPTFDVRTILFNDPKLFSSGQPPCTTPSATGAKLPYVKCWAGHHNHLHVSSN